MAVAPKQEEFIGNASEETAGTLLPEAPDGYYLAETIPHRDSNGMLDVTRAINRIRKYQTHGTGEMLVKIPERLDGLGLDLGRTAIYLSNGSQRFLP